MRGVAVGAIRRRSELRHHMVHDTWIIAKRFAAGSVVNIEWREIPFLGDAVVEGYIADPQVLLIAALGRGLKARRYFPRYLQPDSESTFSCRKAARAMTTMGDGGRKSL